MEIEDRSRFVTKLKVLRSRTFSIRPAQNNVEDLGYAGDYEMYTRILIEDLFDAIRTVFQAFDMQQAIIRLEAIYNNRKNDLLFVIEEPFWLAGDYLIVKELVELLDNFIFAYSDESEGLAPSQLIQHRQLIEILRGFDRIFTIKKTPYPTSENELHQQVERVLVCSFPNLIHKPALTTSIKNFEPDTGIPEIQTLIEYKYLKRHQDVPKRVDEMFCDYSAYQVPDWQRIVYVIYEIGRFVPVEKWEAQFKRFRNTDVVLVKGSNIGISKEKLKLVSEKRKL